MPLLVEVRFVHYSPKDSEEGIKEFILADSLEQAIGYIDDEHMFGALADEDGEVSQEAYVTEEWLKANQHRLDEAKALGLRVDEEYHSVSGPSPAITRWHQGTTWKDAEDAYYGVTNWDWSRHRHISEEDAQVLVRLGIIGADIRNLKG